jgi:hypothetical protein
VYVTTGEADIEATLARMTLTDLWEELQVDQSAVQRPTLPPAASADTGTLANAANRVILPTRISVQESGHHDA